MRGERPAYKAPPEAHARLLAAFAEAVAEADTTKLKALLREDVVVRSDGGGKRYAALNPIHGAERVTRFFEGVLRKQGAEGREISIHPAEINGAPGLLLYLDGVFDQTLALSVVDDRIAAFYLVRNPDKLGCVTRPA